MAGTYVINGPTTIGTAAQLNEILGTLKLTNVTAATGDIIFRDGTTNMVRLPIGAANDVLTTVAGVPAWTASGGEASKYGFMARKNTDQGGIGAVATVIAGVGGWSTASPGYDTTAGDFSTATGVFTVPVGGTAKYMVIVEVSHNADNNSGDRSIAIRVNAVEVIRATFQPTAGAVNFNPNSLHSNLSLVAADTVDVVIYRTGGSATLNVKASPETSFSIVRLAFP